MWKHLCLVALVGVSCSGGMTSPIEVDSADLQSTLDQVAVPDGEAADLAELQVPFDLAGFDVQFDLADSGEVLPECAPGEGCFLDPCEENGDCLSGWCVEHMGEKVCTSACQSECPPGWSCQQVAGSDPDLVFVCVSDFANLCRPCALGSDCKSVGGADDVCVDYGGEGAFCGGLCVDDDDCPWGFSCATAVTVDGISTSQCVADAGVCPCTTTSIELSLWTPCDVANEFGTCHGKRICGPEGLTGCDAEEPALELCNGLDDDCDGDIDEGLLEDDKYVSLCDDGNPCTDDTCEGVAGCSHVALDEGECLDGDPCSIADHCDAGICIGKPVDCDDDNPCTDDSCDEAGGCLYESNQAGCDDGDPCTVADQCGAGECAGVAVNCDCETAADCEALEDGDLCNGTLYCDTGSLPYQCRVDAETVVSCPLPAGLGAVCLKAVCDEGTGECGFAAANDGFLCEDGSACTIGDNCDEGICLAGVEANCNDGNPCTNDLCDPESGCQHEHNSLPCNDGDVCTTADSCVEGGCQGGPALVCDDGNLCNGTESCDAQVGCVAGSPLDCNDGNPCNGDESCSPDTGCVAGAPLSCDDGNKCNGLESCDALDGCLPGTPLICDDQDPCNGPESCVPDAGCVGGEAPVCDDGNPCTDDSCQADEGCVYEPNQAACDDGNNCTAGDHCEAGSCVYEGLAQCDDDNVCTTDSCDPKAGCIHLLNSAPCDDGDLCTTVDVCNLGECAGSGLMSCDDGNECTQDSCEPGVGCSFVPVSGECDDGTACTLGDVCFQGQCVATSFLNCDDGNLCTDDSCNPADGCVHAANQLGCDDGDACTLVDQCSGTLCIGTGVPDCNDQNVCTDDTCDPVAGCVNSNNAAECDDGDKCTPFDDCVDGECVGTGVAVCDDQNICTNDSCDPGDGCIFSPNDAGCEDGNACTLNDSCGDGQCQAGADSLDCDDQEVCTDDSCVPETGCLHVPWETGTSCGGDSTCQAGVCTSPCEPGSKAFTYTGAKEDFVVPDSCATVQIEAWGAQGGRRPNYSIGGKGGYAKGTLTVEKGATLHVYVGQYPGQTYTPGWNGGGQGDNGSSEGGRGGGASDVRYGGTSLNDRVIVAAGGGGGGGMHNNNNPGGVGGGLTGGNGTGCQPGTGATQSAGGQKGIDYCSSQHSTDGSFGQGGNGATGGCGRGGGGGGGGGWYGGGGGGTCDGGGSSAGGGSSYLGGVANGSTQSGVNEGHGKIVLSWP